jgi:hypothetical protein
MFAAFSEPDRVQLTLYSNALVTTGYVRTRQHRITDILNASEAAFLVLEDVTVREFGAGAKEFHAAYAQINLESILFAVAFEPVVLVPELRTPKAQQQAIVSVPPFSVLGTIHLVPTGDDVREALAMLTGRFVPVTGAQFWSDTVQEPRVDALLVAVNHRRAQILAPFEDAASWGTRHDAEPQVDAEPEA